MRSGPTAERRGRRVQSTRSRYPDRHEVRRRLARVTEARRRLARNSAQTAV